jgi:hypothetical protein
MQTQFEVDSMFSSLTAVRSLTHDAPMRLRHLLPVILSLVALTACVSVREGRVVQKRSRSGVGNPYATWLSFRNTEPDVFWVDVEGRDEQGVTRKKSILLFRHDWEQLRVGDHWSCEGGFVPAEGYGK